VKVSLHRCFFVCLILRVVAHGTLAFQLAGMPLAVKAAMAAGSGGTRWCARGYNTLQFLQALGHALKGSLTIRMLGTAFGSCDHKAAGAMGQAHSCLNFIAMLTAGPAGNEKFQVAITF
jgi:hypothetical protein